MSRCIRTIFLGLVLSLTITGTMTAHAAPREKYVRAAMVKATDFMMNTVSSHGGFVWEYSRDLTEQWGEVPARKSQIWVQPPGTTSVGMMLIDAYKVTGDPHYLECAGRLAGALIWGQHPSGGWHYFIDFDMSGVRKWYEDVASQCWGWEEYYHYYGNCTYDDDVTTSAARFLLDLYMTTLDPAYRPPLLKALHFFLQSQYPNGGWPQRYPLRYDFPHDGHADYTSYYTFNDGVISGNIFLLLEAYEKLGNEAYFEAARRGMEFYLISQLPGPQAGWSEQYDMDVKPTAARSYEPASLSVRETISNVRDLETFYMITGDRRFLRGIPEALTWLEESVITTDPSRKYTHAMYYEPVTNKPLFVHCEGESRKTERFWVDNNPENLYPYGYLTTVNSESLRKEFNRVSALTPEEAMAEYRSKKMASKPAPKVNPEDVSMLISSLDKRGAWISDLSIPYYPDVFNNPRRIIKGISTRVYVRNMYTLMNYLK